MECELDLGGEGEPINDYKREMVSSDLVLQCSECEREIPAGTVHEIVTGEYDGEEIELVTCSDCVHISEAFQTEGRIHRTLWAELEECGMSDGEPGFQNFNSACLARVETASAKSYLQERFRKWKGLEVR